MKFAHIPVIDQHAHNILKPEILRDYPYAAAFTEAYDPNILKYHETLFYRRSLRDMARLLDCEPTETVILEKREELGLEKLTELCFQSANIESIFLDDGFLSQQILPLEWHQNFTTVYQLLRLEIVAENIFKETDNFESFFNQFLSQLNLDPPQPPLGRGEIRIIGFKSIAAYRTGLAIEFVSEKQAELSFYRLKDTYQHKSFRLMDKCLIDFLVTQALEIASQRQIPVQFHTGFGDPDLNLLWANPLHLRPILEDSRYTNAPIVLLHGSYPYTREAGYLASVYPQVYVDFGLAVPSLSVSGMRETVRMLLELSPISKIMYSSDAHLIPDLYYLGSLWGREILAQILETAISDGDLTNQEVENIAQLILRENAHKLYQIKSM
jgi:predicted TIM-barrel fold metal-dependent hydrolase